MARELALKPRLWPPVMRPKNRFADTRVPTPLRPHTCTPAVLLAALSTCSIPYHPYPRGRLLSVLFASPDLTPHACSPATTSSRGSTCIVRFFLAKRSFLLACLFFTGRE